MKLHLFKRSSPGFNLVELIIVVSIIAVVSGSMMINYNFNKQRTNIRNAAEEMAGVLRKAQSSALAGEKYQGNIPTDYRVYFVKGSGTYTVCVQSDDCSSNVVESVRLPQGVDITEVVVSAGSVTDVPTGNSANNGQVVFTVPFGDLAFNKDGNPAAGSEVLFNIIFYDSTSKYYRIITVDKVSGNIKIK